MALSRVSQADVATFQLQRNELVNFTSLAAGLPLQDLIVGASIYFPPLFKAVIPGFFLWLLLHRLVRDWLYAGEIWHPMLMDLSLFVLCVCLALVILIVW